VPSVLIFRLFTTNDTASMASQDVHHNNVRLRFLYLSTCSQTLMWLIRSLPYWTDTVRYISPVFTSCTKEYYLWSSRQCCCFHYSTDTKDE